jgi:hypothetical protein
MWRKGRDKQAQRQGLVILSAVYGDMKVHERGANWAEESASSEDDDADLPPPYLDVGIPIQFLVDDFGQLRYFDHHLVCWHLRRCGRAGRSVCLS